MDTRADKIFFCISLRCAVEDCNIPVQFHVLMDATITQTTESELREKLATGYWKGACQNGHPIAITSGQKVLFETVQGKLEGYNPNGREWKDF